MDLFRKRQGHQKNYSGLSSPHPNESFRGLGFRSCRLASWLLLRGHAAQAGVTATPCRGETLEVARGRAKTAAGGNQLRSSVRDRGLVTITLDFQEKTFKTVTCSQCSEFLLQTVWYRSFLFQFERKR